LPIYAGWGLTDDRMGCPRRTARRTLEEIVEIMTWAQLGRHEKPMVFANVNGFWDPMMELMRHMTEEGFLHTAHRVQPLVVDEISGIIPAIMAQAAQLAADRNGEDEVISKM